ncbi:MAG: hypothetical protein R2856_03540 [Caldilineaceae bacterium]
MLNLQKLVIDRFVEELEYAYRQSYGDRMPLLGRTAAWCGKLALENIANSDALYHNLDHTVMVTMVGQAILQGKHLCEGGVSPQEWLHFTIALLCHDIGFVRGVCRNDSGCRVATGIGDETVCMRAGTTDASLSAYHVDRSKLFVRERFNQPLFIEIDVEQICEYIEITRFPIPDDPAYQVTDNYAGLVRAPISSVNWAIPTTCASCSLYHELDEVENGGKIAYESLEDMRDNYARFYWDVVNPYIQDALRYLRVTQEGKQWIANLHSHVFDIEHTYRT